MLTYDDINAGADSTTSKSSTITINKTDVNGVPRSKVIQSTMIKTYFNLPIIFSYQQIIDSQDMIQNSKGYVIGKAKRIFIPITIVRMENLGLVVRMGTEI